MASRHHRAGSPRNGSRRRKSISTWGTMPSSLGLYCSAGRRIGVFFRQRAERSSNDGRFVDIVSRSSGAAHATTACSRRLYGLWGIAMKMSKLGYFSEFLLFPPLVLVATLFAFRSSTPPQPLLWASVYGAGFVAWTLFEYLLHRVLFITRRCSRRSTIATINRHETLSARRPGPAPWSDWSRLPARPGRLLGFGLGTAATAGLVTGYLWYVFVHYATHHWQPRRGSYIYRARLRHAGHHHLPA